MKDFVRFRAFLPALLAAFLLFLVVLVCLPLYDDVDNYLVAIVLNGQFGADNGCQYTHVLLNRLMSFLAGVLPGADVFTLVARFCIPMSFALLLYQVSQKTKSRSVIIALFAFFLFLSVGISVFTGNYGVQAILFAGTGLLLMYLSGNGGLSPLYICGCLYLLLGIMWRLQVALLFIPYVLLELICCMREHAAAPQRWHIPALPLVLVLLLLGIQAIQERREPLRSALEYDRLRTSQVDYATKYWPEVSEDAGAIGVTHADYEMLEGWLLLDTDHMTTAKMADITGISAVPAYPLTPAGLREACWVLLTYFVGESNCNYVWLAGILLMGLFLILFAPDSGRRLQALFILIGSQIIIFYYLMRGRAPMRLIHSVYFAQSFALLCEGVQVRDRIRTGKRVIVPFFCLLILLFTGGAWMSLRKTQPHVPQLALNARTGVDDTAYTTKNEQDVIIWDDWGPNFKRPLMRQGKLPTRELLSHHLPAGEWVYGQTYFTKFLAETGLDNPYEALFTRDHVYYAVDGDASLRLFAEYTPGFHAEQTGTVAGIPIYRFTRTEQPDTDRDTAL